MSGSPEAALEAAQKIREVGNTLFKEGKADAAYAKYQSMLPPSSRKAVN